MNHVDYHSDNHWLTLLTFVFASCVEIQETNSSSQIFVSSMTLSTSDLVSSTEVGFKVKSGGEEGYWIDTAI